MERMSAQAKAVMLTIFDVRTGERGGYTINVARPQERTDEMEEYMGSGV